jgi:hypothetical protein
MNSIFLQNHQSQHHIAHGYMESIQMKANVMSSGTVGTEKPQDTNAHPVWLTIVRLVCVCGLIKYQNVKMKVSVLLAKPPFMNNPSSINKKNLTNFSFQKILEVAGGFACPAAGELANAGSFSRHAHPEDCRKYYICLEGVAREYGCPIGTVFKIGDADGTGNCEDPEDVPGW